MPHVNKNAELKELLSRFFEKDYILPDNIVALADAFLFQGTAIQQLEVPEEVTNTLAYLKNIIGRNKLKNVQDLRHYYALKHQKINDLAETMEKSNAEERIAICIQNAFTLHLQPIKAEHEFKSTGIIYPGSAGQHWAVEFTNISYRHSVEEEKVYLARIDGNLLIQQQSKAHVTDIRSKQIVNN